MNDKEDIRRLSAAFSTLALTISEIVNDRIKAVQQEEQKKLALLQERQVKLQPAVQPQPLPQEQCNLCRRSKR